MCACYVENLFHFYEGINKFMETPPSHPLALGTVLWAWKSEKGNEEKAGGMELLKNFTK